MFDPYKIRDDFPILSTTVYGRPLAYLDSGATAQKPRCVIDKVAELMTCSNANIHRGVHHLSERMTSEYERARERVREFIGARSSEEVIFTSGATAAVNTVAYAWSARYLAAGDNILLSEMEHHSDIVPWQLAAERHGAQIRVLPFDDDGRLMTELLPELIDSRTRMVAVTQASNTLGTRPDLDAVISAAHAAGAVVLVDGCQGIVHGGVDVTELGCDFYVFSGHKLYAPTGIGVLYGRRELLESMPPFMGGGDMVDKVTFERTTYAPLPLKYEAGTSDFIGAAALATAMDYLSQFDACRGGAATHRGVEDIRQLPRQVPDSVVRRRGHTQLRHRHDTRQAGRSRAHGASLRCAGNGSLRHKRHVPRLDSDVQHGRGD